MNEKDRSILRRLAAETRTISESSAMRERAGLWKKLNSLQAERTMALISPEGAWNEIDAAIELECTDETARKFELALRRRFCLADWGDDTVLDATFAVGVPIHTDSWGVKIERRHTDMAGGAYKPIPPLENLSRDMSKLRFRRLKADWEQCEVDRAQAEMAFGDILTVTLPAGYSFWTCGMTCSVIDLIGMDKLLYGMYDEPENIHALMQFLADDLEQYLDQLEEAGLLWYNNGSCLVGSGNCGLTDDLPSAEHPLEGKIRTQHLWGLSESQETVGVSPDMFAEFIWPYQKRLLKRFGLAYYGCCEPVEERIPYIREAENLRAVSVSPWTNLEKSAEQLQGNYVLCHKPNPALMCVGFHEAEIRKDLRRRLDICKGLNNMFILKDTHTVSNEPERFRRWMEIFREESLR